MKKLVLFAAFLLIFSGMITAQVAINTTGDEADPSAILDLQSATKGFLVPRVTSAERNLIGTTQSGLLVYDLTTESFWYYDNTQAGWIDMGSGPGAASINDLSDAISDNSSVFLGSSSGMSDDGTNNSNTGVGSYSLSSVTSGIRNVAVGRFSLAFTTTASYNTAIGYNAALNNVTGYSNVAIGPNSLYYNMSRSNLVAIGDSALFNNGNGINYSYEATANTAVGSKALYSNTKGYLNTALGFNALYSNTTGRQNTAIGYKSQEITTIGYNNTSIGDLSLTSNTTGYYNTAIGSNSMGDNTLGFNNTGVGIGSLRKNTEGDRNVGLGSSALSENLTGNDNTALGSYAGKGVSGNSVSGCVFIGYSAGENNTTDNKLYIDNSNTPTPLIGGDFSTNQVDINGTIKITGGSPGANKVLTSDADGLASWESPAVSSLDDLSDAISDNSSVFLGSSSGINDDGSDNQNAAVGKYALQFNTTGRWNAALGYDCLKQTTTGSGNSAFGHQSMENNINGHANVAVGENALFYNIDASNNTAIGYRAAFHNTASNTTAIGYSALYNNTTGLNEGIGAYAMYFNTTGTNNVALGSSSLYYNETGNNNTAIGKKAGFGTNGTSISGCVFIGYSAGENNTNDDKLFIDNSNTSTPLIGGDFSTNQVDINGTIKITGGSPGAGKVLTSDADGDATWETPEAYASSINDLADAVNSGTKLFMGTNAGISNTGTYNTGIGYESLKLNTSGSYNTALGYKTLDENTSGNYNTGFGHGSLGENIEGYYNTAFGCESLSANTLGDANTALGYNAFTSGENYFNSMALGYNASVNGSNQIHLGNTSITEIKGQVNFTAYSDGRIKENVKENVKGLDFIMKLRPVTYHINLDEENRILGITDKVNLPNKYDIERVVKTGFIAQEVEAAAHEVDYDFSGIQKPKHEKDLYGLSYSEFVVPLVKGMQEQQQQIEKQQQQIETLNKEISELKVLTERLLNQR
jgi:hypothetical protein